MINGEWSVFNNKNI